MICKFCQNLDELERVYPDEAHHGALLMCDECSAEYWEEYGGKIFNTNKQAEINHPELPKL